MDNMFNFMECEECIFNGEHIDCAKFRIENGYAYVINDPDSFEDNGCGKFVKE